MLAREKQLLYMSLCGVLIDSKFPIESLDAFIPNEYIRRYKSWIEFISSLFSIHNQIDIAHR